MSSLQFQSRKSSVGNDAVGTGWSSAITGAEAGTTRALTRLEGCYSGMRSLSYKQRI